MLFAGLEHPAEDQRQYYQYQRHGQRGPGQQQVVGAMQHGRSRQCRQQQPSATMRGAVRECYGDHAEHGRGAAMHHRRAEAAQNDGDGRKVRAHMQIEAVFQQSEACADREAGNGSVDGQAQLATTQQVDQRQGLQGFFDPRRDEARVDDELHVHGVVDGGVGVVASERAGNAEEDKRYQKPATQQLEAVEVDQHPQKSQHGQQEGQQFQ